jgi:hypothetical protein
MAIQACIRNAMCHSMSLLDLNRGSQNPSAWAQLFEQGSQLFWWILSIPEIDCLYGVICANGQNL